MGSPDEFLPPVFMKKILNNIPAKNSDEYLRNVLRKTQSSNCVSGLKTSWFQFRDFYKTMNDPSPLNHFKYVYLYRRDVAQQAVSLYKATETNLFHTNKEHSSDTLEKVKNVNYDFEKINEWKKHIEVQELGWRNFFQENKIYPLMISYEEIDADAGGCINSIASYLDIATPSDYKIPTTVFEKLRDRTSLEYSCQFKLDFFDRNARSLSVLLQWFQLFKRDFCGGSISAKAAPVWQDGYYRRV